MYIIFAIAEEANAKVLVSHIAFFFHRFVRFYCDLWFQQKMEEHLQHVQDFHVMLKIHTDWLNNAEKILASFKHPSKLVERVLEQIRHHKVSEKQN